MKTPQGSKTLKTLFKVAFSLTRLCLLVWLFFGTHNAALFAEGSVDFRNYPGNRLWLDTRDSQEMKVFVRVGEFINLGASHVGLSGGFIRVFNPAGVLVAEFNDPNGPGIISNDVQELNGPTGGGSTNGAGYEPGVVPVTEEGVWTVRFEYPTFQLLSFTNLLNSDPWTRAANQPTFPRVILAWDITVSQGAAGNEGGALLTGRVYTNRYVSIISQNGNTTSPTFYVLTKTGFLYQVDFNDTDPFRFPIFSNSVGIVDGNQQPTFRSHGRFDVIRDDDPTTWNPDTFYLYLPWAQDFGPIINNKIFFNLPDANMPQSAPVTDVFNNNPHTTWLYNNAQDVNVTISGFHFDGVDTSGTCGDNVMVFNLGGHLVFNTDKGGQARLSLDLDGNGSFNDPVDVVIFDEVTAGTDSIFWNGLDGTGTPLAVQDGFTLNYDLQIRAGEIHILVQDVENDNGGISFNLLSDVGLPQTDLFYYDHSKVADGLTNAVSGGGSPGNALPTNVPFTYTGNWGNNKILDSWSFVELQGDGPGSITIDIVVECPMCTADNTPVITNLTADVTVCEGDDITLSATNSVPGTGDITYTWTGPNGFSFTNTVGPDGPFTATIAGVEASAGGTYTLTLQNSLVCEATANANVTVAPVPIISGISGDGSVCSGTDVTLSAVNNVPGIGSITYTWAGPGVNFTGTASGAGPFPLDLSGIDVSATGDYTLTLVSDQGCTSAQDIATLAVFPSPALTGVSAGGPYCTDDDIALTGTNTVPGITSITYTWTGPGGFSFTNTVGGDEPLNAANVGATIADAGDYTLEVTTDAGCTASPVTVSVEINATPVIDGIAGGGQFCAGDDVTLTAANSTTGTGPITYTWTGPNGFSFTGTAPEGGPFDVTIPAVATADSGDYTLTLTTAANCTSDAQSVTLAISPTPIISDLQGGGSYCNGDEVGLSAKNNIAGVGTITFLWQGPNGFQLSGTAGENGPFVATIPNIGDAGAGTYTLTLTSQEGCVSDQQSVQVEVLNEVLIIDITGGGAFCEGEDVALNASGNLTPNTLLNYTWTGPNGFTFSGTAPGNGPFPATVSAILANGAGTYTLTIATDAGCSSDSPQSVEVVVNPKPVIAGISGGGAFCESETVTLTATNSTPGIATINYTWTGPNGFIFNGTAAGGDNFDASVSPIGMFGAGDYTLTLNSGQGCDSDPAMVSIEVNANPVISQINGAGSFCEGDNVTLSFSNTAAGINDFTYTCNGPGGFAATGTGTGSEVVTEEISGITLDQAGAYSCSIESAEGCVSALETVEVSVQTAPVIAAIDGGGPYCDGDNATLTATNSAPGSGTITFTWTGPGGFTFSGTAPNNGPFPATISSISTTQAGTYTLTLESDAGCSSDAQSVEVVVNPMPEIQNLTGGGSVCEGDLITLSFDINTQGSTSVDYTLTGPDNQVALQGTSTQNETIEHSIMAGASTTGTFTITATSDAGCEANPASISVSLTTVSVAINTDKAELCPGGETLTLSTAPAQGANVTYEWFFNGNSIGTSTDPSFVVDNADPGVYSVQATADGCSSATSIIAVLPVPPPDASNDDFQTNSNADATGNVLDNDDIGGGVTVTIITEPSNGTVSVDANGNITYTPDNNFAGTDSFEYQICDENCPELCNTAMVNINVIALDCFIPNGITPNGDGSNDLLIIPCLTGNNFPQNILKVYNRWGDEVFVGEPYTNNWDGTRDNDPLPAGTYYYIFKRQDGDDYKQGFISIIR